MINEKIKNISKILTVSFLLSFILIGNSKVFATNYDYTVIPEYIKNFGGNSEDYFNSVVRTSDNGFVVVGMTNSDIVEIVNKDYPDAIIIKYDKNGVQQWVKSFGGSHWDEFNFVIQTNDDGFIAVGNSYSTDAGFINKGISDSIIVKYDKYGNQQWIKSFGDNLNDWFNSVVQTNDEGFIAIGAIYSTKIEGIICKGYTDTIIIKYDKDGNQKWIKSFGGSGFDNSNHIIQTNDSGFIIVGDTSSTDIDGFNNKGGYDSIIVKYDKDGNQQWIKSFGGNNKDTFNSVIQMNDNGFIVAGFTQSTDIADINNKGGYDSIIVKYDKDGNQQWVKSFGGNKNDIFQSVTQDNNDGFIVVGATQSTDIEGVDDNKGDYDAVIVKYDKDGNQQWIKSFGGNNNDSFNSVAQINDNGFIVVGETPSIDIEDFDNKGGTDAFIIKYTETKTIIPEEVSNNLNIEIVADNSLELSISTNKISFEGYNGVEDLNNDKLSLIISSGLYYDLYATLDSEIRGTNDTNAIIDKANLKIKTSDDLDYKSFNNIGEKVNLVANHKNGRDFVHNINLKLLKDSSVKADTYNTNITFEVVQK